MPSRRTATFILCWLDAYIPRLCDSKTYQIIRGLLYTPNRVGTGLRPVQGERKLAGAGLPFGFARLALAPVSGLHLYLFVMLSLPFVILRKREPRLLEPALSVVEGVSATKDLLSDFF
jgi:hypothetical protein